MTPSPSQRPAAAPTAGCRTRRPRRRARSRAAPPPSRRAPARPGRASGARCRAAVAPSRPGSRTESGDEPRHRRRQPDARRPRGRVERRERVERGRYPLIRSTGRAARRAQAARASARTRAPRAEQHEHHAADDATGEGRAGCAGGSPWLPGSRARRLAGAGPRPDLRARPADERLDRLGHALADLPRIGRRGWTATTSILPPVPRRFGFTRTRASVTPRTCRASVAAASARGRRRAARWPPARPRTTSTRSFGRTSAPMSRRIDATTAIAPASSAWSVSTPPSTPARNDPVRLSSSGSRMSVARRGSESPSSPAPMEKTAVASPTMASATSSRKATR